MKMEVSKLISKSLQEMPASRRQRALAKTDLSKLIHMGLNENNYGMSPKAKRRWRNLMPARIITLILWLWS